MGRPAIFFDRDNTLIVGTEYLGDPAQVVLYAGAADAVAAARKMGFAAVVVSNQSGVARGMFGEDAVVAVNQKMDRMLRAANPAAIIDRHEYCPFHPEASIARYRSDSYLRKPKPGMLIRAAEQLGVDLSRSWIIGDAPRDVEAGAAAGCRTILLKDPMIPPSPAAAAPLNISPDATVASLAEAMDFIRREVAPPPAATKPNGTEAMPTADPQEPANAPSTGGDRLHAEIEKAKAAEAPRRAQPARAEEPERPLSVTASIEPSEDDGDDDDDDEADALSRDMPETESSSRIAAESERSSRGAAADEVKAFPRVASEVESPVLAGTSRDLAKLEQLAEQLLQELKLQHDHPPDFSVAKLMAGILQIVSVAVVFFAYLNRTEAYFQSTLLLGIFLQCFTISLLIMGRQR